MSRPLTPADETARRDAILVAARWCFLHFGYTKTSLADIAARAAISRPLLYRTFKNKEQIFEATYEQIFEVGVPLAERALAAPGSPAERLMRACEILLLQPWSELADAPMVAEFFEACTALAPEVEERRSRRMLRLVQTVLEPRARAEVFLLALDGLQGDMPAVATLRRRVQVLVDQFAR